MTSIQDEIRPEILDQCSDIAELMFVILEKSARSQATISLYLQLAKRFEDYLLQRDPPEIPEELPVEDARLLVEEWFRTELSSSASRATRATYRTIMATYLSALDGDFDKELLEFPPNAEAEDRDKLTWAGRRHPSEPLTARQLTRLRARHPGSKKRLWVRTSIELALASLTMPEIMAAAPHHISLFGQPHIRCQERTIPILDSETIRWLKFIETKRQSPVFPATVVTERSVKRALTKAVKEAREPIYGAHQGIRTLHNTGARQMLRAGRKPSQVKRIYRRESFPKSWNRRTT